MKKSTDNLHSQFSLSTHQQAKNRSFKFAVSGSTGLIGSALYGFLSNQGCRPLRLVRNPSQVNDGSLLFPTGIDSIENAGLEGLDAVIHLAGENIAGRWTKAKKQRIKTSRIDGTKTLSDVLSTLKNPPKTMICASAIGYYGNRGDEILNEESSPGDDFLAQTCQEWEKAADPARQAGIRVVHVRIGIVLSPFGGALAQMLTPFRLGLGGRIGNGRQYMSWITLDDVLGSVHHVLTNESIEGPINLVSTNAITNREFTKTLGHVLRRPTIFPLPRFFVKGVFGEMGDALLLSSTRIIPQKLLESGYRFKHEVLETALKQMLGQASLKEQNKNDA